MAAPRSKPTRPSSTGKVHFSLETLEREKVYELFAADLGERRIEMIDPQELEFEALAEIDNPIEFLELCMTPEDRKYVYSLKLKAWQMNALMDAYMRHYGLGDRGKGNA